MAKVVLDDKKMDLLIHLAEALRERTQERDEAIEALQELYDWQNGCPLPTYEKGWGNAMEMARKVLKKVEERDT